MDSSRADDAAFQRRRIQEALQVFSDLQSANVSDSMDLDRIRASTASAPSGAARPTPRGTTAASSAAGSAVSGKAAAGGGAKSTAMSAESVAQLKHKVDVADAIMKKLHKKNQELAAEIDRLKTGIEGGTAMRRPGSAPSQEVIAALRNDVALKDRELTELKHRLKQQEHRAAEESHAGVTAAGPSSTARQKEPSAAAAELQLLRQRYDELLDAKLEYIAQGEATGKINREVKLFFGAVKHRLAHEVQMRTLDQQLASEKLLELEERLCARETRAHHHR